MAKRFIQIRFKEYKEIIENGQKVEKEQEVNMLFRLGPKAVDLFQDVSKVPFTTDEIEKLGIKGTVYLLYAGCKGMKHDLTIERMWELVDNFELDELGELMDNLFPKVGDEGNEGK